MKVKSNLKAVPSVANQYRVPRKVWMEWTEQTRIVFNRTYDFMINNEKLVTHPKQPAIKPAHWKTIAWNASWTAADALENTLPSDIVNEKRKAA